MRRVVKKNLVTVTGLGLVGALAACSAIIGTRDLTLVSGSDGGIVGADGAISGPDGTVVVGPDGSGPGTDANVGPSDGGGPGKDASCGAADTQTDPKNCGTCGHDCLGGACSAGQCQAFTLFAGQAGALGIAIDSTSVYWTSYTNGQVLKGNKDGTGLSILNVRTGGAPVDLALDDKNVYWTDQGGTDGTGAGTINMVPKTGADGGGVALTPNTLNYVVGLAVDPTTIYWAESTNGAIGQLNRADGGFGYLVAGLYGSVQVAEDDASVFFSTTYAMQKVPKGTPLVYGDPFDQTTDAASATNYYNSGGTETDPYGIVLDATNVYWAVQVAGLIQSASRTATGTVTPTTLAGSEVNPLVVAVDSTNVYWTAAGPNTAAPTDYPQFLTGYVATCPKAGCPSTGPRKLATNLVGAYGLAVDDTAVYFTLDGNIHNATTGSVMKVAK